MKPLSTLSTHAIDKRNPRLHADTYNAVLAYIDRLRQTPNVFGGGGVAAFSDERGTSLKFPYESERWIGIVKATGYPIDPDHIDFVGVDPDEIPDFQEDYSDNRYLIHRAVPDMSIDDAPDAPLIWRPYESTEPQYKIVTATNIAEPSDSHALPVDTIVEVHGMRMIYNNAGSEVEIGRYWINSGGAGGGSVFWGVVVDCSRDSVTGSVFVGVAPLQSTPYGYDPDPDEDSDYPLVTAWAGVDPLVREDCIVLCMPCKAIPGTVSVTHAAWPIHSIVPGQLNAPDRECVSHFTEPCAGSAEFDLCDVSE